MTHTELLNALRIRESSRLAGQRHYEETERNLFGQLKLFCQIGDILLAKQGRSFVVDADNRSIILTLIAYVNGWEGYYRKFVGVPIGGACRLDLPIILCGRIGAGKTLLMQILSELVQVLGIVSRRFVNLSLTELQNYYATFSNFDFYTFNASRKELDPSNPYSAKPFSVCLHDLGLEQDAQLKSYGTDLQVIVESFLLARYDLYQSRGLCCHITTNQSAEWIIDHYPPRLVDRFKEYNFITLPGKGRR